MTREVLFQDKLKRLLEDVASKYRFNGLEIASVERDYPIDAKKADIIVFLRGMTPFLIVETKGKVEKPGVWRVRRLFEPLDVAVVGQAISYVTIYKDKYNVLTPFFATANPNRIAVFKTPRNINDYVNLDKAYKGEYEHVIKPGKYVELIKGHLVISEELDLSEEYIYKLLDRLAKDYRKTEALKVEPTWALIGYFRSFVDGFANACKDLLKLKMERDPSLKAELDKLEKESGYRPDHTSLAKMMAYVLMDKIIFYKVLEEKYKLRKMISLDTSSSTRFMEQLNQYFDHAIETTEDFEPIFKTGIYDMLAIPDDPNVMEYVNSFIATLDNLRAVEIGDLAGYIYEELIPPSERHQLGQFYTPPAICELISKWAIRSPEDLILDPGVGSGGFLLWAYRVLLKYKTGRDVLPVSKPVHERILKQLYAIDINPFPAHLTAVNLAMRDIRAPSTEMNILVDDFFNAEPDKFYVVKHMTPKGELKRTIVLRANFDVIIGNPPYTRWTEIPERTRKRILDLHKDEIRKYKLTPQVERGIEPGIYVYWIMHATKFLKNGGRLGMIISNSWLQTDYGINFGNFLLDNFKVIAVIDFSSRLFRIPLIATCVILLEKEKDPEKRIKNQIKFIYVDRELNIEKILDAVSNPDEHPELITATVEQGSIPRDRKWIRLMFQVDDLLNLIRQRTIRMGDLFETSRGNIIWSRWALTHGKRPDLGSNLFFYLTKGRVEEWKLYEYVRPVVTSSRYTKWFTFTEKDWKHLEESGIAAYVFICSKRKSELPQNVKDYIRWGETECVIKGGKKAHQALASQERAKHTELFCDWYDLRGIIEVPIFTPYYSQYMHRFSMAGFPLAFDPDFICFIPHQKLTETELKALLAYLNSSFSSLFIESHGRTTGGGMVALEASQASEIPILDVRTLNEESLRRLSDLFDQLEDEARKLGGAETQKNMEALKNSVILKIDEAIADILFPDKPEKDRRRIVEQVRRVSKLLMERRLFRAGEARPEAVKGEEEPRIRPPKKTKQRKKAEKSIPLDMFIS